MKRLAGLLAISVFWTFPATAQNTDQEMDVYPAYGWVAVELEPELSLFQIGDEPQVEHSQATLRRFRDLLERSPAVWMIAELPPLEAGQKPQAEFAVTLQRKLQVSDPPSRTEIRAVSLQVHGRNKVYCESPISDALADKIEDVWRQMLRDMRTIRAEHKQIIAFGNAPTIETPDFIYHFADDYGGTGRAQSPMDDTKPGMLAAISTAMRDYCMAEDDAKLKRLEERTEKLAAIIKQQRSREELQDEFNYLAKRLDRTVGQIEVKRKKATSKKDLDDLAAEIVRDLRREAQNAEALSATPD